MIVASLLTLPFLAYTVMAQEEPTIVNGDLGNRIDQYMSRLDAFGLSGALLVAKDGKVVVRKGYGIADGSQGITISADMPFLIGSLSKQFTAAAVLALEMEGKLSTDDSLGRFFPDAPADKAGITIHQLLSHTSGLPYLDPGMFGAATREAAMKAGLALPLNSPPGTGFAYSNPGYTLLAGIIERASGMSYEKYLHSTLFVPAGMASTGFIGDGRNPQLKHMHSYSGAEDEGPASAFAEGSDLAGAGSIYSTVGDLYRWEQTLSGSTVLSDTARAALFAPHATIQGTLSYAYGWNITRTIRGTTLFFHAGDLGGYNAEYRRYTDEGLVIIFLSNRRENGIGYRAAAMNPLSLLIAGASYPAPPEVAELAPAQLERLTGRYRLPDGGIISVWTEGKHLMLGAEGQDGILALANGSIVDSLALRELGENTRAIVMETLRGEFGTLRAQLHPSYPFESVRDGMTQKFINLRDSLGQFRDVEVVGSALLSPTTAQTYLRLRFDRGSVLQMYGWNGDRITAIDDAITIPMRTRFVPASENEIASFDPFTGRSIRIGFAGQKSTAAAGMEIRASSGTITARRITNRAE